MDKQPFTNSLPHSGILLADYGHTLAVATIVKGNASVVHKVSLAWQLDDLDHIPVAALSFLRFKSRKTTLKAMLE
jgi:hypothetical protein